MPKIPPSLDLTPKTCSKCQKSFPRAEFPQSFARGVIVERLVERISKRVDDRLRRRLGREQAVPGGYLKFGQPSLDGRGYARERRIPLGRRDRIDLDPASLEMRAMLPLLISCFS